MASVSNNAVHNGVNIQVGTSNHASEGVMNHIEHLMRMAQLQIQTKFKRAHTGNRSSSDRN